MSLNACIFFQNHLGDGGESHDKMLNTKQSMLKMYIRPKVKETVSSQFDKNYKGLAPQHFIDLFLSTFYF